MDKSAPPAQLHAPPAQRGLFMFGKSFPTPGIHTLVELHGEHALRRVPALS